MKFLSKKTAPTSQNYKDIIAACTMNGKIELALNFYQDMLEQNTQVNQTVLAMLAKGCIKNNALVPKAWEFIFKIYDFSWSPSLDTYETMLYISAREGDANLTRALFFKLLQSGSVTPRAAFYLMMSYSRYSEKKNNTGFYSITNSERGRLFRDHIINDVDYTKSVFEFPMLPLNNLHSEELILAEALAVWSFFSINKPSFLTPQLLSCYLTAVLNHGKLNDFKNVFEDCTYAEVSLPLNRQQVDQTGKVVHVDQDTESEENETKQDKQANHATTSTFDIQIANLNSSLPQQTNNLHKLPRESIVYKIAMRAAAKFRDGELADNIIAERGLYRKSKSYKLLPKRKQIALDFEFACSTVHYYTDVGLFNDALAVILLSEDTFNWSWKEVGKLINTAASLHDTKTVETAKSIIKRVKLRQHSL
ncbi:hypothetical protein LELG_04915 [Lodderomyces elongisporus NRRL YB-4239]|uniref:Pentacotripeptide-repeat region of PRORP domain-containing protein n=1 Tax=Lodderomyces elongisporus (strain ATCC 11503 / CBS 2605 / JCM 1781 / NBRC 1676 / NRRL YB-4239) TaxID=379508 RepID=A5E5M6_LODEL|nr:hypothetical protein LELG_04915 [Lodderomyces elongisporus NRRL YB-4239]